jgi:hypothetical protein
MAADVKSASSFQADFQTGKAEGSEGGRNAGESRNASMLEWGRERTFGSAPVSAIQST